MVSRAIGMLGWAVHTPPRVAATFALQNTVFRAPKRQIGTTIRLPIVRSIVWRWNRLHRWLHELETPSDSRSMCPTLPHLSKPKSGAFEPQFEKVAPSSYSTQADLSNGSGFIAMRCRTRRRGSDDLSHAPAHVEHPRTRGWHTPHATCHLVVPPCQPYGPVASTSSRHISLGSQQF